MNEKKIKAHMFMEIMLGAFALTGAFTIFMFWLILIANLI